MPLNISVIICTHNPRPDYLRRTLDALKAQTLPKEHWELLLIDNASKELLSEKWDLSWHPHARHIREDELGLTSARVRGIKESTGELLVFVDDDNVLQNDYLERAWEISEKWSVLGCWGGCILPEYEIKPASWFLKYTEVLALKEVNQDYWSNVYEAWQAVPFGAGLCVRRKVANEYADNINKNPVSRILDRKGKDLMSAGDIDLVWTSPSVGLGFGVFCQMRLVHLIPKERLELDYLLRLVEKSIASVILLKYKTTGVIPPKKSRVLIFMRTMWYRVAQPSQDWKHFRAYSRGQLLGAQIIDQFKNSIVK